jgi:hypothetical protein
MKTRIVAAALAICLGATSAFAETRDLKVWLRGRLLGTATAEVSGSGESASYTIRSLLDNTPLGVGDGIFEASSRLARTGSGAVVRQYRSRSAAGNDIRTISLLLDGGKAVETVIAPDGERTDLSDPAKVPDGVLDDAAAFARLVYASDCPAPFRIYDGRRVVQVTTTAAERGAATLTCTVDYRVIAGPGHLSPFHFKSIDLRLSYAVRDGAVSGLDVMEASAGLFTVRFAR